METRFGFPDETLLVVGALVRITNTMDVAAVAVLNVPGLEPNGEPCACGALPIALAALGSSNLLRE